jgi:hypothetical protein
MLSEVSQVQKDKGHMFSLIRGRQTQKLNIYTSTNMNYIYVLVYMYVCIYVYIYIYIYLSIYLSVCMCGGTVSGHKGGEEDDSE